MYTRLLHNGSLLLQNVKEDREGYYLCQANNGIGTGIGKVIQLKVNCKSYLQPQQLSTESETGLKLHTIESRSQFFCWSRESRGNPSRPLPFQHHLSLPKEKNVESQSVLRYPVVIEKVTMKTSKTLLVCKVIQRLDNLQDKSQT